MWERLGKFGAVVLAVACLAQCSGGQSPDLIEEDSAAVLPAEAIAEAPVVVPAAAAAPTAVTIAPGENLVRTLVPVEPTPSAVPTMVYRGPTVSRTNLLSQPSPTAPDPQYQYCLALNQQCLDRIPASDPYKVEAIRACNAGFDPCLADNSCEAKLGACDYSGKNGYQCAREKKECDCEAARLECYSRGEDAAACYHDYNRCLI